LPWDDMETLFISNLDASTGKRRLPEILKWWRKLHKNGCIANEVVYSTKTISTDTQGNVKGETRICHQTIPSSVFDQATREGTTLLSLFVLISSINYRCFKAGMSDSQTTKHPLNYLADEQKLFTAVKKGKSMYEWSLAVMNKYSCSSQFLSRARLIFEEAMEHSQEATSMTATEWNSIIQAYKQRIIELAKEIWNTTIVSVPISSISGCRAVGKSQQRFNRTIHGIIKHQVGTAR